MAIALVLLGICESLHGAFLSSAFTLSRNAALVYGYFLKYFKDRSGMTLEEFKKAHNECALEFEEASE